MVLSLYLFKLGAENKLCLGRCFFPELREAGSENEFSVGFSVPCWASLPPAGTRLR